MSLQVFVVDALPPLSHPHADDVELHIDRWLVLACPVPEETSWFSRRDDSVDRLLTPAGILGPFAGWLLGDRR